MGAEELELVKEAFASNWIAALLNVRPLALPAVCQHQAESTFPLNEEQWQRIEAMLLGRRQLASNGWTCRRFSHTLQA
jgi:hypothetical protein